jgi:hypothetical protein
VLGAVLVFWFFSPTEQNRRERVGQLEVGDPQSRVTALLGEPGARCPAGDLAHLRQSFAPGWPGAAVETTLQELSSETAERWVYPLGGDDPADCDRPAGTELGFDAAGRVLWLVAVLDETHLELPDRFTPATTAD